MSEITDTSRIVLLRQHHLNGDITKVPSMLPAIPTPFVGRTEEIRMLRRRLLAGPRLVFLTGPGGIGKTALAITISHHLIKAGYFRDGVLWIDGREALSYGGMLDDMAQQLGQRVVMGRSLGQRERHLLQQIADHDYLLAVDNLDSMMEGRREAVQFLRRIPGAVLVTTRLHPAGLDLPERLEPMPPPDSYLLLKRQSGKEFGMEEVQALLRELEGMPMAIQLVAARITDGSEIGHLLSDLTQFAGEETALGDFHGQVPSPFRAFLAALKGVSREQRQLLLAGSSLRRSFSTQLIAYIVEREDTDSVLEDLRTLNRRGLLEHTVRGWRVHDMLVSALETRVSYLPSRTNWHRRAATVLARGSLEDQLSAADHWAHAGDARKAVALLIERSEDLIEAGMESQLATQLSTFVPDTLGRDLLMKLSEVQGDVAARQEQYWEATRYYDRALDQLKGQELSDSRRAAATRLSRKQAQVMLANGEPGAIEKAELWLQRAMSVAGSTAPGELVRVALLKSRVEEARGEIREALRSARQALGLARRFNLGELLVSCYQRTGNLSRQVGDDAAALSAYESALAVLDTEDDSRQKAELHTSVGEIHRDLGDWIPALEAFEASLPYWHEVSLGRSLCHTLYQLGTLLVRQGEYNRAQTYLQEAQVIARRAGLHEMLVRVRTTTAEALLHQNDHQVAHAMLQECSQEAQERMLLHTLSAIFRLKGEAAHRAGNFDDADQMREQAIIWARRSNDPLELLRTRVAEAIAYGDMRQMEVLREEVTDSRLLYERTRLQLRLLERWVEQLTEPEKDERAQQLLKQTSDEISRLGTRKDLERIARLHVQLKL